MCTYSSPDGHLTDYHLIHLGGYALHGASLTIIEVSAVHPDARTSPDDAGIWDDSHIRGIKRVVDFAHSRGQKIGIQIAHSGRKGSMTSLLRLPKGKTSMACDREDGGWPQRVKGPSPLRFGDEFVYPKEMSREDIANVVGLFRDAAIRAVAAGVDIIEIHGAHGYLLSSFLSRRSNCRTDEYGGSFENRTRLPIEVVQKIRSVIPTGMPLFYRVSGTEWTDHPEAWRIEDTIEFAKLLATAGIDLLTISSGGMDAKQKIPKSLEYQVNLSREVRLALRESKISLLCGAVGRITQAEQAKNIIEDERTAKADIVLLGRQFMRDPAWVLRAAGELGVKVQWPAEYSLAMPGKESRL